MPITLRVLTFGLLLVSAFAEEKYFDQARVTPIKGRPDLAEVRADYPRPLYQLIFFMDQHYGWVTDYEDPPYASRSELVGSTTKAWLASGGKEYYIPAGGGFSVVLPEADLHPGKQGAAQLWERIATEYGATTNPGFFKAISEARQRYTLSGGGVRTDVGAFRGTTPILDVSVRLRPGDENAWDALNDV